MKRWGIGSLFLGALLVMVLWNAVLPDLFGLPRLGYWQALIVLLLSRLLFGGLPTCGTPEHPGGRWRESLAAKLKEKCEGKSKGMSDEDKERFKRGFTSGKWDVNIIEIEEEEQKDAKDPSKPDRDEDSDSDSKQ